MMVFVDETGIHLAMSRSHGYSPVGERLYSPVPFNRGKNFTLIGALGFNGMVSEMLIEGSVDKDVFLTFLEKCLIPELKPGQVVIMDNLSVHKYPEVEKLLQEAGNDLIYLPPYNPQIDPAEHAWAKFKEKLCKASARTYEKLLDAVRDAIASITPQDAQGWFAHCGYSEPCNKPL